jgi:hypothetical protein
MIALENTLVSLSVIEEHFACQVNLCKGACCVEGDYGAPLEDHEIFELQELLPVIQPFMTEEGMELLQKKGFHEKTPSGEKVTTCRSSGECVFAYYDELGIAKCAVESAWQNGSSNFKKPISCHLYPIRLSRVGDSEALNYHEWSICSSACDAGTRQGIPLYVFLKDALIRKFGEAWYDELNEVAEAWKNQ